MVSLKKQVEMMSQPTVITINKPIGTGVHFKIHTKVLQKQPA